MEHCSPTSSYQVIFIKTPVTYKRLSFTRRGQHSSLQQFVFLKSNSCRFFQMISNLMYELRNILFRFPSPHTFLLGSELFSSYSANSSQSHSLIAAKGRPASPQTPEHPAEVSGRAKELGKRLGKQ